MWCLFTPRVDLRFFVERDDSFSGRVPIASHIDGEFKAFSAMIQ